MQNKTKLKIAVISIIVLMLGVIAYSLTMLYINRDKTATIDILVAPTSAEVVIDGESYPTKKTIKVKPGTYTVKIKKDGFIEYNGQITANADETAYLYEYLNEIDENGTFYKNNQIEAARAQEISDKVADRFHKTYNGTDKIWNVTPYDNYPAGYKIYAQKDQSDNITITIYLYTCDDSRIKKLKEKALEYLNENQIDLNKYTVKYKSCE
jgi:hypothetical protein